MNRWFRYYEEALHDPKVLRLSDREFRVWVNLLCVASKCGGRLPPVSDLALELRMDEDAVRTVVERLVNGGMIDRCSGGPNGTHYAPHNWEKRQFKSDTSTERVKRFRKRSRNVTETAPDTESDTEEENPPSPLVGGDRVTTKPSVDPTLFETFWRACPRRVGKDAARRKWETIVRQGRATPDELLAGIRRFAQEAAGKEPQYVAHPATWLNQGRWADEPATGGPAGNGAAAAPAGGEIAWSAEERALFEFRSRVRAAGRMDLARQLDAAIRLRDGSAAAMARDIAADLGMRADLPPSIRGSPRPEPAEDPAPSLPLH